VWGLLFIVSGLAFTGGLLVWAVSPSTGLPYALIPFVAMAFFGYRIWRADHRYANPWGPVLTRAGAVVSVGITAIAVAVLEAAPWLFLVLVAAAVVFSIVAGTVVWLVQRRKATTDEQPASDIVVR
jgi:hypothetical protein